MSVAIGIPKELTDSRVAATPGTVKQFVKLGLSVLVEKGAGEGSFISDAQFKETGAKLVSTSDLYGKSDIVLSVNSPNKHPSTNIHQLDMMKDEKIWISHFLPHTEAESVKKAAKKKLTIFSMNLIPRITRAQKMDSLSSQSNISGYKAVLLASVHLGKMFPLMMTAAGTIKPAKVVIMGAGVAGLSAIATAKRLGAQVEASDIRPAAKEQVESLGAKFIDVPTDEKLEDEKGYAKEASKEFLKKQAEEVAKRIKVADVVVTTALIPGRKAPVLISEAMVKTMKQGSVIVDLAAPMGGNCALTKDGKVVEKHGVTIVGESNMPGTVSVHATEMYAKNIYNFVEGLIKEKKLSIDTTDEIYREAMVKQEVKKSG